MVTAAVLIPNFGTPFRKREHGTPPLGEGSSSVLKAFVIEAISSSVEAWAQVNLHLVNTDCVAVLSSHYDTADR